MPIVPGVIIIEALAQLSGLVGYHRAPSGGAAGETPPIRQGKLAHVEVRFDETVFPPADIMLTSRQTRVLGALRQFDVQAFWQNRSVARGRLTLAVAPKAAGDEV
jgi:3-hydroxymyristoyl/3-hydroxydecanoyl-(acyl carrier protein) dehydratase